MVVDYDLTTAYSWLMELWPGMVNGSGKMLVTFLLIQLDFGMRAVLHAGVFMGAACMHIYRCSFQGYL